MNRAIVAQPDVKDCMPHVGGDEPFKGLLRSEIKKYAPRMWG